MAQYIRIYYPNGILKQEYYSINNMMQGKSIGYNYINDNLHTYTLDYINSKVNGQTKSFYENGQILMKTIYINDLAEGEDYKYWKNGNVSVSLNYKNGKYDGEMKKYNLEGKLFKIQTYIDGIPKEN